MRIRKTWPDACILVPALLGLAACGGDEVVDPLGLAEPLDIVRDSATLPHIAALAPDDAVAAIQVHSGQDQWELAGSQLAEPVVVRAVDEGGRPVRGAPVVFEPENGGGRVHPEEAATDSLGLAGAAWTLGDEVGKQRLVAAVGSSAVELWATAVADEGVCNRTPQVSAEIARQAGVGSCAEVTDEQLARIGNLTLLQGTGIRRLRQGDFDGLASLVGINLNDNHLSEVPPGVFHGLHALDQLSLSRNELGALPGGVFDGLASLQFLDVSANVLVDLPPGIFDRQVGLQSLRLGNNRLTRLPPGVFGNLKGLEQLILSGNRLTDLTREAFGGLEWLRDLRVANNNLVDLPEDVFVGVGTLETLDLSGNNLSVLPEGIFAGLSRLRHLSMDRNPLSALPPGLFSETPALVQIRLHDTSRLRLPAGLFSATPALERLYLHQSNLAELPDGIFDGLSALVRLNMGNNPVGALPPDVFGGTPKLAELDLYATALDELPRGLFAGLSELRYADLSFNPGSPFPVRLQLVRVDSSDPLAPGPARVVVRVPLGAPYAMDIPVSVQRGTSSLQAMSLRPGDTTSAPFIVAGREVGVATHVGLRAPPETRPVGYDGLEAVPGEQLVLFAADGNRSPVVRSRIPAHRMQAEGPRVRLELGEHFADPDGDTLRYEVETTAPGAVSERMDRGRRALA